MVTVRAITFIHRLTCPVVSSAQRRPSQHEPLAALAPGGDEAELVAEQLDEAAGVAQLGPGLRGRGVQRAAAVQGMDGVVHVGRLRCRSPRLSSRDGMRDGVGRTGVAAAE